MKGPAGNAVKRSFKPPKMHGVTAAARGTQPLASRTNQMGLSSAGAAADAPARHFAVVYAKQSAKVCSCVRAHLAHLAVSAWASACVGLSHLTSVAIAEATKHDLLRRRAVSA